MKIKDQPLPKLKERRKEKDAIPQPHPDSFPSRTDLIAAIRFAAEVSPVLVALVDARSKD